MQSLTKAPVLTRSSERPFVARIPGSKSYTNRALLLAAQRQGVTVVENGLHADDTILLARALGSFDGLAVETTSDGFRVERTQARLGAPAGECHMGGAGTPARFLLAFAAAADGATVVTGIPRLCERPMGDLLATLTSVGVRCELLGQPACLPVRVHGGPVATRDWRIHAGVSSQFTSSLLFLAAQQPLEERGAARVEPVRIHLDGHQVSRPYVQMTLAMMNDCGIRAERQGDAELVVHGCAPKRDRIRVETDASGMSYFLAAAALTGTSVEIPGIGAGSAQGDVGLAKAFGRMGCAVELREDRIRLRGAPLAGIEIDMEEMPDVALTLAAVAATARGATRITNIANLRLKECDRIHAAASELSRLGVEVEEGADFLVIHPPASAPLKPARIQTYDDHRVAMSFAILGLASHGIEIEDPGCVAKSFPGFWDELDRFRAHHSEA